MKRWCSAFLLLLTLTVVSEGGESKLHRHRGRIATQYMVHLDPSVQAVDYETVLRSLRKNFKFQVLHRWDTPPYGFVATGMSDTNAVALAAEPIVRSIEEDFELVLSSEQYTWTRDALNNDQYLWYLDRLDEQLFSQRDSLYAMCPEARGAVMYILDTGIRADHEQLTDFGATSRVVHSRQFAENGVPTEGAIDSTNGCNGATARWHGTAVASVAAGTTIGASKPDVVSLRYWRCDSTAPPASALVNAVRWIRSSNDPYSSRLAVVNYSGGVSQWDARFVSLNTEVLYLVTNRNVPFFTSAENFSGDACMWAPNNLAYTYANRYTITEGVVMAVGGTSVGPGADTSDYRWQVWETINGQSVPRVSNAQDSGSNGGRCVSVYAPANEIYVASNAGPTRYMADRWSGTSFSSPMVAAIALRYMHRSGNTAWRTVYDYIIDTAAASPAQVNHVGTPEYWLCEKPGGSPRFKGFLTYQACPAGYTQPGSTSTIPLRIPPTNNESNAGIVHSDMTCP